MGKTIYTYAGFWKRFLAYLIDSIIMNILSSILFIPIILLAGLSIFPIESDFDKNNFSSVSFIQNDNLDNFAIVSAVIIVTLILILIAVVVSWLYSALMESSSKKATLGKMALGLIVTDMQGDRITFARASGRFFAKILSGLILNIGFIMAAFTQKKQALHDIIADTLVLEVKRQDYSSEN
ncbi:MAG: RDD family protein [bacterium]